MTTCTPTYGFTYSIGSDSPCSLGDTLCEFAEQVEAQLDALDAIVDRTVDSIPMAKVRMTITQRFTYTVSQNIQLSLPFDTVDVDTADMVDLDANPYTITLPRPGAYFVALQVLLNSLVANDTVTALTVNSNLSDAAIGDGTNVHLNASGVILYDPSLSGTTDTTSPEITLDIFGTVTPQTLIFSSAMLNAIWLRDLP